MRLPVRTESYAKLFFLVSCLGLIIYTILAFYTFHTAYFNIMTNLEIYQGSVQGSSDPEFNSKLEKDKNLKYILLWANYDETTIFIGEGQIPFFEHKCSYTNCYLTRDKNLLNDYTKFEAIIFDVHNLRLWKKKNFPKSRSNHQKYIFHSKEPSDKIDVCSVFAEAYFNWTWTYKLDSDIVSPFIEVIDLDGNFVAPKETVEWKTNMTMVSTLLLQQHLKDKKKAMAWVSKKCNTGSDKMRFAKRLQAAFRENSLTFNIYGCGNLECPTEGCLEVIRRDYYFYFAPEYSEAEDYVTEEVLTAYDQYAVPIVIGGTNYRKFLPEGSYINAGTDSIDHLVTLVDYIIRNPALYYNFHRWRNYYSIRKAEKFKGICEICEYLNDKSKFDIVTVKRRFREWWHSEPLTKRCFPKDARSLTKVLSYIGNSKSSLQIRKNHV